LALVKEIQPGLPTKSSLILGLGEESVEVKDALRDLRAAGCDIVTLGQYLPPSRDHPPATDYIHPDLFNHYRDWGLALGFSRVLAGPFVRSSLLADECSQSPISSEEGSAMKTTVTARHFELTEPLRVHADETFQRLRRFFNHIAEVHVILETEKYRHRAEATLRLENGTTFVAAEQSNDMYLSLDRSAEKLETQLRRYKEKFRTRKLHGNNKEASLGERD
jgi:ribosomal subunit interface protein